MSDRRKTQITCKYVLLCCLLAAISELKTFQELSSPLGSCTQEGT